MNAYEIMLMLEPELADERQNEIVSRARELVEQGGGAWIGHEAWGRRKLAYEIEKRSEAYYHLLQLDCEPSTLDELTRVLKIMEGTVRLMAVRRTATTPRRHGPPAPAAAETVRGAE